ncbi:MAG TPA: heparan-alpha-glucosaminide N-acetyltransferase domain-containing protein [Vicinamibacterales bacterium]|nr:heparan-alpha-glucosaminide N-acetyltransferase domain-containing protein [Vicinamibacterales bacterium]
MTITRQTSIDAVRGAVMVIMALDHVRDFFDRAAMIGPPEDLATTTPALFMTRWITHVCAPAFVFLAGVAATRQLRRDGSKRQLSRYLWTRGLWLVLLEITVMRVALNFRYDAQDLVMLIILSALGMAMIVLAALIYLPPAVVGVTGVAIVALHNLLDPIQARALGNLAPLWMVMFEPGVFTVGGVSVLAGYPVVPWVGVMAIGFSAGRVFDLAPAQRARLLAWSGAALVAAFLVLRAINHYGDPSPWSLQASSTMTVLSFLRTTKYPPSLIFLLMTLGPVLLALAWFERRPADAAHPLVIIGRVPLFYFVGHFFLAHLAASLLAWWHYGDFAMAFLSGPFPSAGVARASFPPGFGYPLWVTYLAWVLVVAAMYPLCRWYGRLKRERPVWWMRYV